VVRERLNKGFGDGLVRNIVMGWPDASAGEHIVERSAQAQHGLGDVSHVVGDDLDPFELDSQLYIRVSLL